MPKIATQMSERKVASLKEPGRYAVGGVAGLYLEIGHTGYRFWVLRYQAEGRRKDMSLGSYPQVGLAQARLLAIEKRALLLNGVDPLLDRQQKKLVAISSAALEKTFEWCVWEYIKSKEAEWKNAKHRQQWGNTLSTYAFPYFGQMHVSKIEMEHVLQCLQPIWFDKTETAKRLRGRIESVLAWAHTMKYRQSPHNPATWNNYLENLLPSPAKITKVEHHKALESSALPKFMSELREVATLSARALELLIYTATRSNEVRKMTWGEVDIDRMVWTIPAERMKSSNEHSVPLSKPAQELLKSLPRIDGCELVFPGQKNSPLSDMTLLALVRRMGIDAVPHGFRSTFSDWAGDETEYERDLIEFALAHKLKDKVAAAYRRKTALERRRALMEDWAEACLVGNVKKTLPAIA